jgi:CRISPR-associated protein Cmr3
MHVQEDTQATKQQENIYEARLHEQFSYLGGERRIVSWRQAELALPACPDEVIERVLEEHYCRLILLTPGIFDKGYYPTRLLQPRAAGVSLTLKACKVAPPDSISGWDIDKRKPKASRRLAPAGSVYFVKLHCASQQELKSWLEQTWFSSISDQDQDQLDGFGVVALGTWSGAAMTPEEQAR